MTAVPGTIITPATLAETWFGPELVYNLRAESYETHVQEIDWSGNTTTDTVHVWVPPADAQILGVTATTVSSENTGSIEIRINGNVTIDGKKLTILVNATPTRANLLTDVPRVKVGAGDQIVFTNTQAYDDPVPEQFRIHIVYQIRWGAL
jgi:hypothetical protein